ncbi:hypothetical protein Fmac_009685 [Flemingia macrophylla]|uniref:Uncharacterized protein n=1 Tax=Flemingia macrophylla TaxID=520843 RepID=A0ABD1N0X7_9FABA
MDAQKAFWELLETRIDIKTMSGCQLQNASPALSLQASQKNEGLVTLATGTESKPKKKICCACPDTERLLIDSASVLRDSMFEHQVHEVVGIIHLMLQKGIVPETVNTIFEADKKAVAAPKIVVEDLLKKGHITYHTYELLYDGIRDKKILKKRSPTVNSFHQGAKSSAVD